MKQQYDLLIAELKKLKLKKDEIIKVHLLQQEIIIETHRRTSEGFDNKIYSAHRKVEGLVWGKNVSACEGLSDHDIIDTTRI
jgi:hypothetical protein